jgi:hypothetical protein
MHDRTRRRSKSGRVAGTGAAAGETALGRRADPGSMALVQLPSFLTDPIFVGLAVLIVAFIFFVYLMLRRTLLGLQEGFDEGRRNG